MHTVESLLISAPPTLIPADEMAVAALLDVAAGTLDVVDVAAKFPTMSAVWALLAERALDDLDVIAAYAYARTGYHRGLDALRANGWRGAGPVPWSHEPNRGFLRCVAALARAAAAINETNEAARCTQLLFDCDPQAAGLLV